MQNLQVGSGYQQLRPNALDNGQHWGQSQAMHCTNFEDQSYVRMRVDKCVVPTSGVIKLPSGMANLPGRRELHLYNLSTQQNVFIGDNSGVTYLTGFPLMQDAANHTHGVLILKVSAMVDVWATTSGSTTADVRCIEFA